jgi:hypothetical protein
LKRSNQLVRGYFWAVFLTATLAFILEEAIVGVGALAGALAFDSDTWGEWIGAVIAGSLILPLAALTTSIAHRRLSSRKRTLA